MLTDRKHADFEVPDWGEFARPARRVAVTFRPVGLRPDGLRAVPMRPGSAVVGVESGQSFRPVGWRGQAWRPEFFRPQPGSGWVVQRQSGLAAFPDRPQRAAGAGVRLTMSVGQDGRYVEHDAGAAMAVAHIRVLINPATAAGGTVVLATGLDEAGVEVLRLAYDAGARQLSVALAGGTALTGSLLTGLLWHSVEVKLDTVAGEAQLWVNGLSVDSAVGSFSTLGARRFRLGGVEKDTATVGELYLDEWVIGGVYAGPVVVEPATGFGNSPASWVVIYNTALDDSVAWVEAYRAARGVPYANLLGLDLPTSEVIDQAVWSSMSAEVTGYLSRNMLAGWVRGFLIGFGVPGVVTTSGGDVSVASMLVTPGDDTADATNPAYTAGVVDTEGLPARAALFGVGRYLVGEMNAPTLADALALISRSEGLESFTMSGQSVARLDPASDRLAAAAAGWSALDQWLGSVPQQQLRLPREAAFDGSEHGHAVELTDASDGAFTVDGQTRAVMVTIGENTGTQVSGLS